jgi:hypothetical protein
MDKKLMFKDWVKFEERNGYFNSIGLKLTTTRYNSSIEVLNIYPITSKKRS